MSLKRILPPPSLTQIVAERVREAIMTGVLKLGENISEDRLVAQFGVSRTPVRDAIAVLSNEGLVVVRPKRGSFVFETSPEDIVQLCDYRQMLERQAVRAAILVGGKAYISDLKAIVAKMDAAISVEDGHAYSLLDNDFHRLAFEHCGNVYMRDAYALISGRIAALRSNITAPYAERRAESLKEHHRMVGLLEENDLETFDKAIEIHVQRTGKVYRDALADGHLGQRSA